MWLSIIAVLDKLLGIVGQLTGWWIKRSDESKKQRDAAQAEMDLATKEGNFDAYWNARAKRNKA